MATEREDNGLVEGIILGTLVIKGKRTAALLYASEFLGIEPERLDSLLFEAMARMLGAAQEWATKGESP